MIFVVVFRVFFRLAKFTEHHQEHPLDSSESCLKSPDGVMIKLWKKSKVPFFYGPSPTHKPTRYTSAQDHPNTSLTNVTRFRSPVVFRNRVGTVTETTHAS